MDFLAHVFDANGWVPRRLCGTWDSTTLLLHICSDLIIWVCYSLIPVALWLTRRDAKPQTRVSLFIAFILSCGITHLAEVVVFWWPAYRLFGVLKAITAGLSLATVMHYFFSAGRSHDGQDTG